MIKEYKLNKKIWKNMEEFNEFYDIFINTPKRKKKNCITKISNSRWSSLTAYHRYYSWQITTLKKKVKKPKNARDKQAKIKYKIYIQSKERKDKRIKFINKYKNVCQCCKQEFLNDKLNVHHHTYKRVWEELDSDLTVVCLLCHHDIHFKNNRKVKLNEYELRKRFKEISIN